MKLYEIENDSRRPVSVSPEEAERMGAFVEDALSEEDAAASRDGLRNVGGAMVPDEAGGEEKP
jgi:hypothetical protein